MERSGVPLWATEVFHLCRIRAVNPRLATPFAHRRYPATLEEIATGLEARTLTDLDGQRLRYRTTADGQRFTVWSIGRNGLDDLAAATAKGDRDDMILSTEEPPP